MNYTGAAASGKNQGADISELWMAASLSGQHEFRTDCPHCSKHFGDNSLSLNVSKGVGYCHRCQHIEMRGKPQVCDGWPKEKNELPSDYQQARFDSIKNQCKEISNEDPVTRYLFYRLGGLPVALPNVSYHPSLRRYTGRNQYTATPAMVAALQDVSGRVTGWHTTAITKDGHKAFAGDSRRYCKRHPLKGSAVRLYPAAYTLIVAEGIETALALHIASSEAVWACTSAALLASFEPPPEVNRLLIAADNDQNRTGQKSADRLYQRLKSKVSCAILTPKNEGKDWLDELIGE